jgi:uncharacterized membrane-anchored protein YjiN (DUF445 family)
MEQPSNNEYRYTDEDRVYMAVSAASERGEHIGHADARTIAAMWHDGQSSDLYSFVSTGLIGERLDDEITATFDNLLNELFEEEQRTKSFEKALERLEDQSPAVTDSLRDAIAAGRDLMARIQNDLNALAYLAEYVHDRQKSRSEVPDGWIQLWIGKGPNEEMDNCPACGEHFSDAHAPRCPFDPGYED